MNALIQQIIVAIAIIGAVAWIVVRIVRGTAKSDAACKDCPLVDQCAKKRKCHNDRGNCGC